MNLWSYRVSVRVKKLSAAVVECLG
jgi:hypothetical protein